MIRFSSLLVLLTLLGAGLAPAAAQAAKLRDMQRAWIASKEKTCAFYWDYY